MIQSRDCITIVKGSIPAIIVDSHNGIAEAVMAMNFLRNGSPSVQFVCIFSDNDHAMRAGEKLQTIAMKLERISLDAKGGGVLFAAYSKVV